MIFKRGIQRYGHTPQPETPYQRAGQLWDERIGSARVQARNWRLMAFAGMLLSSGLAAGLIWQSGQSRVVPYVVAVDHLGEATAMAPASATYQPDEVQIAWHLARFIADIRTLSLDPIVMRQNWLEAYRFATPRGALFLNAIARANNPFADIGTHTTSVQVTSVVKVSDRSYQAKWTEIAYERGSVAGSSHWTAVLTIIVKPPTNSETLRHNPLGLYVDAVDWNRELEPASATGAGGSAAAPPSDRAQPDPDTDPRNPHVRSVS